MAGNKVTPVIGIWKAPNLFNHESKRLGSFSSRKNRQQGFVGVGHCFGYIILYLLRGPP